MKLTRLLSLTSLSLGLLAVSAHADVAFKVTLGTSSLVGNALAPFSLDVQLNSGDTLSNNTATLKNFSFGTGSVSGTATTFGGATGSLASTVTLTDSTAFNEFYQGFISGNSLTFEVVLTTHVDTGLTPDSFSISLLDKDSAMVTTTQPSGANALVYVDINNNNPILQSFASTGGVTVAISAIPEPSTYAAILGGLALAGVALARRRRA